MTIYILVANVTLVYKRSKYHVDYHVAIYILVVDVVSVRWTVMLKVIVFLTALII